MKILWFVACLLLASFSALAHHSFAIFDHTRTLTLAGEVRDYQWTNPHGYIRLKVDSGADGAPEFLLELTSINMLRRAGWRSSSLKPGDRVTVVTAPLLDGEPGWEVFKSLLLDFTGRRSGDEDPVFAGLSERERQVLERIAAGDSNAEISATLFISEKTVKNHITHIFEKLGVMNRSQAIVKARDQGFKGVQ